LNNAKSVVIGNVFEGRVSVHCAQKQELEWRFVLKLIEAWQTNVFHLPIGSDTTQIVVDVPFNFVKHQQIDVKGGGELS
jgi:hypothetical protein